MIIYAAVPEDEGAETQGFWMFDKVLERQKEIEQTTGMPCGILIINLENINHIINRYFDFRGYDHPDAQRSLNFVYEEAGELARAFNANQGNWVRNNPREKEGNIGAEAGDVLMMMTKMMSELGISDPIEQMLKKMVSKGFIDEQENNTETFNEKDESDGNTA